MESTISKTLSLSTPSSLNPFISRLHRYVSRSLHRQCLPSRLIAHRLRCFYADRIRSPSFTPAHLLSPLASMRCTLQCVLGSTAPVCACGGCGGGSGSNGGSGGGRVDGNDLWGICSECEENSGKSREMAFFFCSNFGQPQVSAASVNLTTETTTVRLISEAKAVPNWKKELGEILAKNLTNCGFKSNPLRWWLTSFLDALVDLVFVTFDDKQAMEETIEAMNGMVGWEKYHCGNAEWP